MTNMIIAASGLLALVAVVILTVWAICKIAKEGFPEEQWYVVLVYLNGQEIHRELCFDWDMVEESRAFWPTIFPDCETKVVDCEG